MQVDEIQSPVGEGIGRRARAGAFARQLLVHLAPARPRPRRSSGPRRAARARSLLARPRAASSARAARPRAASPLRLLAPRPCGAAAPQPAGLRLEKHAGRRHEPTKIAVSLAARRAGFRRRAVRTTDSSRELVAGSRAGRPAGIRVQQHGLPAGRSRSSADDAAGRPRACVRPHSTTTRRRFGAGRRARGRLRARGAGSRPGSARRPPRAVSESASRASSACRAASLAASAPRRIREPIRREEGRDRERAGRASARYAREGRPGSKPWTTSKRPGEREREVRADADGHAHLRAPGDRYRRARPRSPRPNRDPCSSRRRRAGRGARWTERERSPVPAPTQSLRGAPDVRVHLVRLRPRERRDETDAQAHASQVTSSRRELRPRSTSQREAFTGSQLDREAVCTGRHELDVVERREHSLGSGRSRRSREALEHRHGEPADGRNDPE